MNERMRVLMISTSYPENDRDWRGRFIADIVKAMATDRELDLSVWVPPGTLPAGVTNTATTAESAWMRRLAASGGIAASLRSGWWSAATQGFGLLRRLRKIFRRSSSVDVVHINWLQNALPLWGTPTPALITVLGSDYGLLRHRVMRQMLRAVIRQRPCLIAPNAAWMVPNLQGHFGDIARVESIPFGVDPGWFQVRRGADAAASARWLVISRLTSAKIGALFEWGNGLFDSGRELHLLGPRQESLDMAPWVRYHGPTNPGEIKAQWFPQSAGLITLSSHDEGRPQVILEAMAAGLPVIASDHPAHRDVIRHGETGWLVRNATEFAAALRALEVPETNREVGERARSWVARHVGTWDDCVRRYKDAYRRLINPGKLVAS